MTLDELQAKLRSLLKEGDAIIAAAATEKRELTDDEETRMDAIGAEMDESNTAVGKLKKRAEARQKLDETRKNESWLVGARSFSTPDKPLEDRNTYSAWPVEEAGQFFQAIRSFEVSKGSTLPSDMNADLRDTFIGAVEKRAPTGQSTLFGSEGGFLIPSTISSTILQKVHGEGTILSKVQEVPITVGNSTKWNAVTENARTSGNRYGGITVARKGEAVAAVGSQVELERVSLDLKELKALVYLTDNQLEDGPQMMSLINDLVPLAITFKIEDELFNGDNVTQMQGILGADAMVEVAKEAGQTADTVLYENIVNMYSRMWAASRSKAVWFINQDVEPQLFTMSLAVGTGGVPVYLPANGVAASPFGTLMGRPVMPVEHAKKVGDAGDIILADMSQYLYATKGGVKTAQSIHVKFVEGEVAFRFTLRNDGKPWWPSALTPVNGLQTLSPFVKLALRA